MQTWRACRQVCYYKQVDFNNKLAVLGLPAGSYVVVGSGILQVLGIRQARDIDLVVSAAVFERLRSAGWELDDSGVEPRLRHDDYDAGCLWLGKTVEEVLPDAVCFDGIPYAGLRDVLAWKRRYRPIEDAHDIERIERYIMEHDYE